MKFRGLLVALLGMGTAAGAAAAGPKAPPEHAVIVHFQYGSKDLSRLFSLEEKLEAAILAARAGDFDGDEVAEDGSDGFLYMYGPDADRLYAAVKPVLEACDFMRGARVTIRYGGPDDATPRKEVSVAP